MKYFQMLVLLSLMAMVTLSVAFSLFGGSDKEPERGWKKQAEVCRQNAECQSGKCLGNWYGVRDGVCT